ncbi:hypothetical protein TCAL_07667 [Tigriopus californicus]|uniref:RRM domain-containing protein n=1 Tax=Tigriopus californicus TaxID=6832 RepID=A0A553NTI9_TIGCA|nr:hypothetical protein TCAL_07667 [Tigriopus californicus]
MLHLQRCWPGPHSAARVSAFHPFALIQSRPGSTSPPGDFVPFRQWMDVQRATAKRSLVVQVRNVNSAPDLYQYCADQFGPIKGLHFYQTPNASFSDFYIVEFEDLAGVQAAMQQSQHSQDSRHTLKFPVQSPFLWFSPPSSPTSRSSKLVVSEEIQRLQSMFPMAEVLPFGSSVNSYGSCSSDVDMVALLSNHNQSDETKARLVFHAKGGSYESYRAQGQIWCRTIGDTIRTFLPGCNQINSLWRARVPIVKYKQELLGLECDLSYGSSSGYHMSELLYIYGELDPRVRPLVCTIRHWAKMRGLTETQRPTQMLTNFSVTLLVLFFLMNQHQMLPPMRTLYKLARLEDRVITDDDVVCTFLRDLSGRQSQLNARYHDSKLTLTDLLLDFFKFYGDFDYKRHTVCILTGECQPKRTQTSSTKHMHSCLSITNPLEPDLNVCANVTSFGLDSFKANCQKGYKFMTDVQLGNQEARLDLLLRQKASKSSSKVNVQQMFQEEKSGNSQGADVPTKENPRHLNQMSDRNSPSSVRVRTKTVKSGHAALKMNTLFKR